jgi:hypothetical protein
MICQEGTSGGHNFDRQDTQQDLPSYLDRPHSDVVTRFQLLNGQEMLATDDPHPRRDPYGDLATLLRGNHHGPFALPRF